MRTMLIIVAISFPLTSYGVPDAYRQIAEKNGVSAELIYSIALVESGRTTNGLYRPWPWTLNINEKPYRFKTRKEAYKTLKKEIDSGNQAIAIGLMQIYWRYNKSYFSDPWEALDPYKNIDVGAKILTFFKNQRGTFENAVGAYYSPNDQSKAEKYKSKVRAKLALVLGGKA